MLQILRVNMDFIVRLKHSRTLQSGECNFHSCPRLGIWGILRPADDKHNDVTVPTAHFSETCATCRIPCFAPMAARMLCGSAKGGARWSKFNSKAV